MDAKREAEVREYAARLNPAHPMHLAVAEIEKLRAELAVVTENGELLRAERDEAARKLEFTTATLTRVVNLAHDLEQRAERAEKLRDELARELFRAKGYVSSSYAEVHRAISEALARYDEATKEEE